MKKIFFLISLLVSITGFAQPDVRANRIIADQGLFPPVLDTLVAIPQRIGQKTVRPQDGYTYQVISLTAGTKRWAKQARYDDIAAGQVYPGAGIPNSTGSGWGISYSATGTGSVVALQTSPTLITPVLGVATATSINKITITQPATGATLTIPDGTTINTGVGGTLGTNAFTSTAYAPIASPIFTGTVTIPTPFTLGVVSVTSTGTQLNYLNTATGTTGTNTTNIVYSGSPTIATPSFTTGFTVGGTAVSRKMIVGNGTNFVPSTETWAVPGTSRNLLISDGTNWTSTTLVAGDIPSLPAHTLQQVTTVGNTSTNAIVTSSGLNYIQLLDSIFFYKEFTNASGMASKMLWQAKTEKYNTNYPSHGTMGDWKSFLMRNWYNSTSSRPGEILYDVSYNSNFGGGRDINGEPAFQRTIESNFNDVFEVYDQYAPRTGFSFRPIAYYANNIDSAVDMTLKNTQFHIAKPEASAQNDHLRVVDGQMNLTNYRDGLPYQFYISGDRGANSFAASVYSNAVQFTHSNALATYSFDRSINPAVTATTDLGSNSLKWSGVYSNNYTAHVSYQLLNGNQNAFMLIKATNTLSNTGTLELPAISTTKTIPISVNGTAADAAGNISISSAYLPLSGGTMTGNILATDNTYDLGASGATRFRTGYFGTSIITPSATISGMTLGSILVAGTGGLVTQDNANLFWDDTNNRLGIGTATPRTTVDVVGRFRSTAVGDTPASGTGLEMWYHPSLVAGLVFAYDRTLSQGRRLYLGGDGTSGIVVDATTNVGIGTGTGAVATSAKLELVSTTQGFLQPRMTNAQLAAISSPATGLSAYSTTALMSMEYNGSAYKSVGVVSGSFSGVGTATTVFTVTFGGTQPNATYKVNVTPTAALSAALFYVTNKTTTTFDVTYLAGLTGTVTFDWAVYQ